MNIGGQRKIVIGILCMGILTLFVPFAPGETSMLSRGKLILSWARSVYEADVQTKQVEVLRGLDDKSFIYEQLSKVDDERFLYERESPEQIYEYNRKTRAIRPVRPGSRPTYVPEHDKFFFYHHDPAAKQTKLYVADLKDPIASAREVERGSYGYPLPVIQVGRDEVVFSQASDRNGYKVWHYNIVTSELKALPLKNCTPAVWRSATQQLLCGDMHKQSYYLTNLDGTDMQYLPELKDDIAEAYVPEYDTLILGKVRFELFPWPRGERHSVWAYRFKERKMVRLLKDVPGGRGAVIWYER